MSFDASAPVPVTQTATALPRANPAVVYRKMPDGAVLFSPESEEYFGLNETAACVWENLPPVSGSMEELCAAVLRTFPDAGAERVNHDVPLLVASLVEAGLLLQG